MVEEGVEKVKRVDVKVEELKNSRRGKRCKRLADGQFEGKVDVFHENSGVAVLETEGEMVVTCGQKFKRFKKQREKQEQNVLLMDLEKAYDSVCRDEFQRILCEYGVEECLVTGLKSLYDGRWTCVECRMKFANISR